MAIKNGEKRAPRITTVTFLAARRVVEVAPGVFSVEVEGTELLAEDRAVLRRLFPSLTDRAYDLLNEEALMASVVTHEVAEAARAKCGWGGDNEVPREM